MDEMWLIGSDENSGVKEENRKEKTPCDRQKLRSNEKREDVINVTSSLHAQLDFISQAGAGLPARVSQLSVFFGLETSLPIPLQSF